MDELVQIIIEYINDNSLEQGTVEIDSIKSSMKQEAISSTSSEVRV